MRRKLISIVMALVLLISLAGCSCSRSTKNDDKTSSITLINTKTEVITKLSKDCEYTFDSKTHHKILNEDGDKVAEITTDMGDKFEGMIEDAKTSDIRKLIDRGEMDRDVEYLFLDYKDGETYSLLIKVNDSTCLWVDSEDKDVIEDLIDCMTVKSKSTK